MAEAILNVSVTARGSAELSKIETSIRHIRQASVGAISDQIRALKELYAVTPAAEHVSGVRGAMRDVLQNMTELGGKSKMTASDIASANDTIAASIKRVNEAIAERTPAGTEYKPESGRWHGPTGFVKTPGGLPAQVPHLMKLRDVLLGIQEQFFAVGKGADFFIMKGERVGDVLNRLRQYKIGQDWAEASKQFGNLAEKIGQGATKIAEMQAKVSAFGQEFQVIQPLTEAVSRALGGLHREAKTFELVANAGAFASQELATGFAGIKAGATGAVAGLKGILTKLGALNPKVLAVMAGFAALRVTFLAVRKAINIIVEGARRLIDFLKRLAGAVRDIVRFMRNLIRSLVDAGRAVYNFGRRVLETAKNMTQRFLGGVRSLVGGLRNLVPSLRDSSSAGDDYNRTFYLTTRRSYEAARAVDFFASVATGFTTGLSLARGNLTALAFSANQLRRSIIPVFAATTALTLAVVSLGRATKGLIEKTTEIGANVQDVIRHFASLTGTMAEGEQMWMASIHWAMEHGRTLEQTRESAIDFYQAGLDVNEMLDASHALAAAWNMELNEAAGIINTAVGEQEGQIETLKEYGIVLEDITNETERNTRATAIATAIMEQYGSAASEYVNTLSGAMERARTVVESFWEVLTRPLANVLAPIINAFSDFASTIVTLTQCLWESDRAQSYFNRTMTMARNAVNQFRPEITILGNIVRLIVTAAFWALQRAMRGVVQLMERMLTWARHLIGAFSALIRPIKPLASAFNALSRSWKDLAFTDLLQRVKEFVLDFPITILGIETSLRALLDNIWDALVGRIPEHVQSFVASLGVQLLAHLAGIKDLSISGVVGSLVSVLINWLGRAAQDFLTEAFPHLEDMFVKMFDIARWMSIIGGAFFGVRGALVGYLAGLFVGYLDDAFDLGIHDWVSTALTNIGNYFREKWNLFWRNLFQRERVPGPIEHLFAEDDQEWITGINFDAAFTALFESFRDDWNQIFLPTIQRWLGMEEGGVYQVSDYIGHAMMRAVEGAKWIAGVMVKLYELLKQAWEEHLVPFWQQYVQPEIDNLWETYLRPPLSRLAQQWSNFWRTMFRGLGGTAEVGVTTDIDWGNVQDPSQIPDMGFDAQGLIDTSPILRTVQGLIDDIGEIFERAPTEEAEILGKAVYDIGEGLYHMGRGAYFAVRAAREIYNIMLTFSPLAKDTNDEIEKSPGLLRKLGTWFDWCSSFIKWGSEAIEGFYHWLVRLREWIDEKKEEMKQGIKDAFALEDLQELIEDFKNDFEKLFDETLPGIIQSIEQTIFTPIKNAFVNLYNELFGNTWSQDMVSGWEGMWADFAREGDNVDSNVFETIRRTFNTWKDTFFENWKNSAQRKWDELFGSSGSLRRTANNTDSNIFVQIRNVFNSFINTYMESFKTQVSTKWNEVFGENGLLQRSANTVKQRIIDPIASRFTYFRDHQWPGMIDPLRDRWQYIFGGDGQEGFFRRSTNEFLGAFRTWASNFTSGPVQTIINGLDNLRWWLQEIINKFWEMIGVRNTWNSGSTSGGGGGGGGGGFGDHELTAQGGVFRGAQTRIIAEAGPEAVIPLTHGAVPVRILDDLAPSITVVIKDNTFGSPEDAKEVADIVSREILRRLRVRGVSATGRF